jgi:hypothetical protein
MKCGKLIAAGVLGALGWGWPGLIRHQSQTSQRAAQDAGAEPSPITLTADLDQAGDEISYLLFGQNLGLTGRAMWRGLGAQLLANRKFAGPAEPPGTSGTVVLRGQPDADGVAAHWYGIGKPWASFALDPHDPYVGATCQRIALAATQPAGVGQKDVPLHAEWEYLVRLHVKSDRPLAAKCRLVSGDGKSVYSEHAETIAADGWRDWSFSVRSQTTDEHASFEVTFDGPGRAWVGCVSLLPADHFRGLRSDVVKTLKDLAVPLLRWPGGGLGSSYRWQDALLPVDRRPPIVSSQSLPFADDYDLHDIGTDEYIDLCHLLGAEPFITVNMKPDLAGAQDAADWVEYCNAPANTRWGQRRAAGGRPKPYAVYFWSLGDESGKAGAGRPGCSAAEYARRLAAYATAMHKVDPCVGLGGAGLGGAWDQTLVAQAGQHLALLAAHDYAPAGKAHTSSCGPADYERLARYPAEALRVKLHQTRADIDAAAPHGKNIALALGAWNVCHDWLAGPHGNQWGVGPTDGVFTAAALNMLAREAAALKLRTAAFFQPVNDGLIAVGPFTAQLTTAGQVFALYIAHRGSRVVPLDCAAAGPLDGLASVSAAAKRAQFTFINRDPARERRVVLRIVGYKGRPQAFATKLAARDLSLNVPFEHRIERLEFDGERISFTMPRIGVTLVQLGGE